MNSLIDENMYAVYGSAQSGDRGESGEDALIGAGVGNAASAAASGAF